MMLFVSEIVRGGLFLCGRFSRIVFNKVNRDSDFKVSVTYERLNESQAV